MKMRHISLVKKTYDKNIMKTTHDYILLVQRAQEGDKTSLNELAEHAVERLEPFVYRVSLNRDLTRDIVQETVVDLLENIHQLREPSRFWPWVYGIAMNELRRAYYHKKRNRIASGNTQGSIMERNVHKTLDEVVSKELQALVMKAMQELSPRHRTILTMRCYDQMSYAQIAELMECTEFGARALFCRAKKSLAKRLKVWGLGKKAMAMALLVFGRITATTKTAAAAVTIPSAMLNAGPAAAFVAFITDRIIATVLASCLLVFGSVGTIVYRTMGPNGSDNRAVATSDPGSGDPLAGRKANCYWPAGADGSMMLRITDHQGRLEVLQTTGANYRCDRFGYRMVNRRWSMMEYQDDNTAFLSQLLPEVNARGQDTTPQRTAIVQTISSFSSDAKTSVNTKHNNALFEDWFVFDPQDGKSMADERDPMHQRGWTYFRVQGSLCGTVMQGRGCVPFVEAAKGAHSPWLTVKIGSVLEVVEADGSCACILDDQVHGMASGSFFQGLCQPWRGFHTIDIICREAQGAGIDPVVRKESSDLWIARVSFDDIVLTYEVDPERDVIQTMKWKRDGKDLGQLHFEYLQDIDHVSWRRPLIPRRRADALTESVMQWWVELPGRLTE